MDRARGRSRGGWATFTVLSLLAWAEARASVAIQSFSMAPASPDTGDPVVLSAVIQSTSSCNFIDARIGFEAQGELGGRKGWGIDIEFRDGVLPVVSTCPIETSLGTLPVAAGDGVLRARNDGIVNDVALFTLAVDPGPAAGWDGPALHGGFSLQVRSAAATSLPGRLAVSDLLNRQILLLDPRTGDLLSSFRSPGSGDVRGLAWDGSSFFASVRDSIGPRIYRLDLPGRVLDVFPSPFISPGNAPLEGLAYLNGVLYGSYESPPTLFAINPSTHVTLWNRPLRDRILALDAAPEGLLGAEPTGSFYFIQPDPAGEDILLADPHDTGITTIPEITGLAYDGSGIDAWDQASYTMMSMRTFALWWAVDGTLQAYVPAPDQAVDVIRGDLDDALQTSSFFDLAFFGPPVCIAGRSPGGVVADPANPPVGHAFFYLARFIDAAGNPSFYGRTSDGFRRIDTSDACP
jgi:hypothetical protein